MAKATAVARDERKPARGGAVIERAIVRHLADHGRHSTAAQGFCHRPQHVDRARHREQHIGDRFRERVLTLADVVQFADEDAERVEADDREPCESDRSEHGHRDEPIDALDHEDRRERRRQYNEEARDGMRAPR